MANGWAHLTGRWVHCARRPELHKRRVAADPAERDKTRSAPVVPGSDRRLAADISAQSSVPDWELRIGPIGVALSTSAHVVAWLSQNERCAVRLAA